MQVVLRLPVHGDEEQSGGHHGRHPRHRPGRRQTAANRRRVAGDRHRPRLHGRRKNAQRVEEGLRRPPERHVRADGRYFEGRHKR